MLEFFYRKLIKINDTPQKIALGIGLGVFTGILPGAGPLVALFLAFCFKANRAAALLGSLFTNTWLSIVAFIISIKVGSSILGIPWQGVKQDWNRFLSEFRWLDLFKLPILKMIFPVILGYLAIAFCLGLAAYLAALLVIIILKRKK